MLTTVTVFFFIFFIFISSVFVLLRYKDSVTGTGYWFRYGFVLCSVLGYELRRLVSLVICFMYCFRIRAQETRKPCYLFYILF